MQRACLILSLARFNDGNNSAARIAIMAMTTSNSRRVNPLCEPEFDFTRVWTDLGLISHGRVSEAEKLELPQARGTTPVADRLQKPQRASRNRGTVSVNKPRDGMNRKARDHTPMASVITARVAPCR